jgi:hypothetical protein
MLCTIFLNIPAALMTLSLVISEIFTAGAFWAAMGIACGVLNQDQRSLSTATKAAKASLCITWQVQAYQCETINVQCTGRAAVDGVL